MRFNPSFFQLKTSIDEANNFGTSIENANPQRSWLLLCPNEVYNQYVLLDENLKETIDLREISKAQLVDSDGNLIQDNLGFGYKKYPEQNALLISFKILKDYKDQCLCIRLVLSSGTTSENLGAFLFSNLFTCSEFNKEKTSIITYWHRENHYSIPYNEINQNSAQNKIINQDLIAVSQSIRNQIRLPLYFKKWKTEQDSTENTYETNTPTNINVSRVTRREIKIWNVVGGDWINNRLAIVSDSDFVYINGQREITRPYEYEEVSNGSDFSISNLESQLVYGDEFIDLYGLVNHKPAITAINFPNGNCCNPDGTPIIEPEIINEETLTDTCQFQGIRKRITVQGQPNSTIKYRLSCSEIKGSAKKIFVTGNQTNNSHTFINTVQNFVGYFYIGSSGQAQIIVRCCLEDCVPGNPISINANLQLYKMDGLKLSEEVCNINSSKTCPLPIAPQWVVNSQSGTNIKNVRITGQPNSTANFVVRILSEVSSSRYFPKNNINIQGFLNEDDVEADDTWEFSIPINGAGTSASFNAQVEAGSWLGLSPQESNIYASLTLRDVNGGLSNQVIGISDINQRN